VAATTDVAAFSPTSVILKIDKESPVSSSIAGKLGGIEKAKTAWPKRYMRREGL
jgi:hypothetical protein